MSTPVYQKVAHETLTQAQSGQTFRLRVNGSSMFPILQAGEDIHIQASAINSLTPGDIVSVKWNEEVITHRFIDAQRGLIFLKGDNFSHGDPPIPPENILGRVFAIEKHGKQVQFDRGIWKLSSQLLAWLGRQLTRPGQSKWRLLILKIISISVRWLTRWGM